MTTKQEQPRIGGTASVDLRKKPTLWQRTRSIGRAIRKDIQVAIAVAEMLAYTGMAVFALSAVNMTLRNEPLRLNDTGLLALLFCTAGMLVSLVHGYWEHLLKRDKEWDT